ncbi:3-oxoacyl-[acyl-carrier-protein] reductase [Streptomyces alkaliterrae]|uniref:3-oxoacyl-[acyl-carrier-protein] reductase n=1 Tax=Streptomyces alkaliterrae TaxID=2213162 RepID=A0A5P0YM42_9ACTN|nr:3-oxoacyl-[acyl-carrier-protein] reductase [Streptomyces alkaliterrae]MBB1252745.1 3-oxoacyl-[acyl-carrier-protein] reductase [Streptomyces alkaliterrae]MBB1258510.1 3-oxoacyl-[acyl-carrier-protein] reductase [Streptomyces alkaliterrae]MQS00492.1 3-oxoacyl-[acyl-carrier-protein] reductase [Streptomyces alkaliterrae]
MEALKEEDNRRVAIVTGGSRGIGRATVLALARDGFDVAFCYRANSEAAELLVKEAGAHGGRVLARRVDVADGGAVRGFVAEVEAELGPVDAAVTAAGITRDNPLVLMEDEQWHQVLDTNLDGVYHLCRAVVFEMMKRRSGVIVNISSVAGVYGHATQTNYSASKAAIIGFSRSLAKEVGRSGIRVNTVAPGFVDTDMVAEMNDKARKEATKSIPLRRMGTADEVADLVSFLVSDRAAYITGAVLQIDGGITI